MGITRHYIKEKNFVLTLLRDKVNDEHIEKHVLALTKETRNMHPLKELADASKLQDLSGISENGLISSASIELERGSRKKDKLAILVSSDEAYKLALIYTNISAYYRYDTKILRDYNLALKWLGMSEFINDINIFRQSKSRE